MNKKIHKKEIKGNDITKQKDTNKNNYNDIQSCNIIIIVLDRQINMRGEI